MLSARTCSVFTPFVHDGIGTQSFWDSYRQKFCLHLPSSVVLDFRVGVLVLAASTSTGLCLGPGDRFSGTGAQFRARFLGLGLVQGLGLDFWGHGAQLGTNSLVRGPGFGFRTGDCFLAKGLGVGSRAQIGAP